MNKRICKELDTLEKNNKYRIDNYIYYNNSINIILNHNFIVKIKFKEGYPFCRPSVYINYKKKEEEYINFTHLRYPRYITQLEKENIKCFCKYTMMCKDWIPSMKIETIIGDVLQMKNKIRRIIYNSYINKICSEKEIPLDIVDIIIYQLDQIN